MWTPKCKKKEACVHVSSSVFLPTTEESLVLYIVNVIHIESEDVKEPRSTDQVIL